MKITKRKGLFLGGLLCLMLALSMVFVHIHKTTTASAQTSDGLYFSLINNSQEYSVSAWDQNITEANIPAYFNGKPVTEVQAFGFMFLNELKTVIIPETVRNIKMGAFIYSENLENVYILINENEGVQKIEDYAFAYTDIKNFIVPKTVVTIEEYAFEGISHENIIYVRQEEEPVAFTQAFMNFSGTTVYGIDNLVPTRIMGKDSYAIGPQGGLNFGTDTLRIPFFNVGDDPNKTYDGFPIEEIRMNAFNGSTIGTVEFAVETYNGHNINLLSMAFFNSNITNIILNNHITMTAPSIFVNSTVENIVLPGNINQIPNYTFRDCKSLKSFVVIGQEPNYLPDNLVRLGNNAFINCTSLQTIHIQNAVSEMDENIFEHWTANQTIRVHLPQAPSHWSSINWNGGNAKVKFDNVVLTFDANYSGAISSFLITASPDATLAEILGDPAYISWAIREGYNLTGWFFDPTLNNEALLSDTFDDNVTLYAGWEIKTYNAMFDPKGFLVFNIVEDADYHEHIIFENGNFYVKHGGIFRFTVTVNSGYNQSTPSILVNNAPVTPSAGVYTISAVNNDLYITVEDMPGNFYTVTYSANSGSKTASGNTPNSSHMYNAAGVLSANGFSITGYTFLGWSSSQGNFNLGVGTTNSVDYGNNSIAINVGTSGTVTLFAVWQANTYTVIYRENGGGIKSPTGSTANSNFTFDIPVNLRINGFNLTGYEFLGWSNAPGNFILGIGTVGVWADYPNGSSVINLKESGSIELFAVWGAIEYTFTFNKNGGTGGSSGGSVSFDSDMPLGLTAPTRVGRNFEGYFTGENGTGRKYYHSNMTSANRWIETVSPTVLYAHWSNIEYFIDYIANKPAIASNEPILSQPNASYDTTTVLLIYDVPINLNMDVYRLTGWSFIGWNTKADGTGTHYSDWLQEVKNLSQTHGARISLYARWEPMQYQILAWQALDGSGALIANTTSFGTVFVYDQEYVIAHASVALSTYDFVRWGDYSHVPNQVTVPSSGSAIITIKNLIPGTWYANNGFAWINLYYKEKTTCVAEGTLITLADGTQKAVEDLSGDELLLVWNHHTGTFDAAPIVFIHANEQMEYNIIHLFFSDGSYVKVIYEHAFWNHTLNRYVFFRDGEGEEYIGHWFNKLSTDANNNPIWLKVQLLDIQRYKQVTTAWSPVTFAHLNFYTNGLLSMPGDTEGLINIFEVDALTLAYDHNAYLADIAMFGLFEYADFADLIPAIIFEAFNVQYLAVSLSKGLITWERIEVLIEQFSEFFV